MSRLKTLSKNYFDDEIEFIYPNGDIHLKEGVTRLKYRPMLDPQLEESYLNFEDLAIKRRNQIEEQLGINTDDGYEGNY